MNMFDIFHMASVMFGNVDTSRVTMTAEKEILIAKFHKSKELPRKQKKQLRKEILVEWRILNFITQYTF